jgi:hypothetical protein
MQPRRAWQDHLRARELAVLAPLAVLTLQFLINAHIGLISDLHSLYYGRHLNLHPWPYIDARIEYPVLLGVYMTAAAALTHSLAGYLLLSRLGLWACGVGCVLVLWPQSRRAAWCFAASPLLLVFSVLNWDVFAIFLMLLGWRAWRRDHYALAALWLTLGTFAKLYPAFLLLFCFVALLRRWRDGIASRRDTVRYAVAAVATAAIVNGPFAVIAPRNWLYFWKFNASRNSHQDLLAWLGLLRHASLQSTNTVLTAVVLAATAVGVLAVWRRHKLEHVVALVFFLFMLMQKVYSPQYALWLLAYAVIADWEVWTVALLSLMGIVGYTNAVIAIQLIAQHHRVFAGWYQLHIFPLDHALRMLTTLGVGLGMVVRRLRPRLALAQQLGGDLGARLRRVDRSGATAAGDDVADRERVAGTR